MASPGSEASHDEQIAGLLGPNAETVLNAPVRYTSLAQPEVIEATLVNGGVCRIQVASARILIYHDDHEVKAVVTELAHGGYRRKYKSYAATCVLELVEQLLRVYPSS